MYTETPDEVSKLGTGKNAKDKGQEGTEKGKPPYKKATKDNIIIIIIIYLLCMKHESYK